MKIASLELGGHLERLVEKEGQKAVSQSTILFLFCLVSASLKIPAVYPLCSMGARSLPALFCQIKLMGRKIKHTDALNPRLILQSFGSCIQFSVWFKSSSGDTQGLRKSEEPFLCLN